MVLNSKNKICVFFIMVMITVISKAKVNSLSFHPECGESPVYKYKELANAIGWDINQLIRFMRAEKKEDYEKLIRAVKLYADCVALSQIPIK
ncbi:hypothetical protein BpHYR1_030566 [Brachionus plicatilis]|uniref:Uncharacterized protein n=1 Tax=Brachionus plicatilis TaxID=10195 RepID=A0A3M7SRE7_BRAPC|nr:hypothetical protein BpHYR1_030566 [Brachionus plicatilis]